MDAVIFKGGMPYGPDVKLLCDELPVVDLTEGTIIRHERLEAILRVKRQTGRYYAVVNSWIGKQKHDNAIHIIWERQIGLKVLDPAGLFAHAEQRTREKAAGLSRAVRLFGWVDRARLDATGQQRLDHQMRVASAIKTAVDDGRKQLAIELAPVKSLPKPKLVREAS